MPRLRDRIYEVHLQRTHSIQEAFRRIEITFLSALHVEYHFSGLGQLRLEEDILSNVRTLEHNGRKVCNRFLMDHPIERV